MAPLDTPGTVFGYCRVSTEEQADSGLGIDAQRAKVSAAAQYNDWDAEAIVWCTEEGVSGTIAPEDRPCLGDLLSKVAPGDVLVTARLDRIGRSAVDVLLLADRAKDECWDLMLLDVNLDTRTPMGRAFLGIAAVMAQMERDLIAERTRDALAAAKRRGQRLGRPVALPDDLRDRIVSERERGATLTAIAERLNAEGVPTARGGRWHSSTIRAVIQSVKLDREAKAARIDTKAIDIVKKADKP